MLAYQTDIFTRHGRGARKSAKDGYVQDSLSSRLSVSNALDIQSSRSYHFLIYSSFYLVGLARGTVFYGVQLAWGFPPRCKWTYGEVFHPAVVPRPHFSQLVIQFFGAECYQDCILLFYDMSYILQSKQGKTQENQEKHGKTDNNVFKK